MRIGPKIRLNTRRHAPDGYVAVTRPSARLLFDAGLEVTLCGNNVNSFHVFGGWRLGYSIDKTRHEGDDRNNFEYFLNNFLWHLDRELGTYAAFYVRKTDLNRYTRGELKRG